MIRTIVTDIEGTTSSIAFVHQVLFPYAREHLGAFVRQHRGEAAVEAQLAEVARLGERNPQDTQGLIDQLQAWIEADQKITPLKVLQGMIWQQGYEQGDYQGHIYPDAEQHLRQWHEQGLALYVYSSGSVQAQKLLFAHTAFGDLTPLFSGYFDTTVGGKKEAPSYQRILADIDQPGETVLFLSDVEEELAAARAAGMQVCWLVREGALPEASPYPVAADFSAIRFS